ncbi:MAG: hypothetical protein NTW87_27220 [Planctomycetota bacterium]|nr:hypothetical protein [Planctomycetota bacterium]
MTHVGHEHRHGTDHSRTESSKKSARIAELLNAPASRRTPSGTDTAWALKLRAAVDVAVRELDVQVLSAKAVMIFSSDDQNDMLFEMDTERGRLQAIRSRSGVHTFRWMN